MIVYRITKQQYQDDISGDGARMYGGRWNPIGTSALYTSETRALASLELLVHTTKDLIPPKYKILSIEIPFAKINDIPKINISELPDNWKKSPPPDELKLIGTKYLIAQNNLAVCVPSTIISKEYNIVINPMHPDFKQVKIIKTDIFEFDERLLS